MRSFFKILLACFSAITITLVILFFVGVSFFTNATEPDVPEVKSNTVLMLDLAKPISEQKMQAGFDLPEGKSPEIMGLYDIVRALKQAAKDSLVKGIYLQCRENNTGFASTNEIRNELLSFKKSGKFIIAASDYISQRAYEVANVADNIYCTPQGVFEWKGYAMQLVFLKGALDKLEIQPEIFYAGQFKGATEPFRLTKMSEPNRRQLSEFIDELYSQFLLNTSVARDIDTNILRNLAADLLMREPEKAASTRLVDAVKYDDEVKKEIKNKLGIGEDEKISFMQMKDYIKNGEWNKKSEENRIAVIYAEGEVVDGDGDDQQIGGDHYRRLINKARLDKNIKAVVLRINSPGGSAMAGEELWREIALCKKEKPFIVSMSDYAASCGYYISCHADSIFAQPNTLTGSIGVFSMYFNAQQLFNKKLGITFDVVKTAPYADYGTLVRPMTEAERGYTQAMVDSVYLVFKKKVAKGRNLPLNFVDSIAQGHIWSGKKALELGLVDRLGGLQDAIDCAARMAKVEKYSLVEWPIVESFWKKLFGGDDDVNRNIHAYAMKQELGEEEYGLLRQFSAIKSWSGIPQMRLPFFASFK